MSEPEPRDGLPDEAAALRRERARARRRRSKTKTKKKRRDSSDGEAIDEPVAFTPELAAALAAVESPKTSWTQGIAVLGVTLALFLGAGMVAWDSTTFILALLVVIIIHELGHLVAMRAFGYQDLRMFFLPLFGAAVSGCKPTATGTQRAIVSLAGPLPGIVLSVGLMVGWGVWLALSGSELPPWTETLGSTLLVVNYLNLLPLLPFDGGRFMGTVLFNRHPLLETVFRVLAGVALAVAALSLADWIFGFLAFGTLVLTPTAHRVGKLAFQLAGELDEQERASPKIPEGRREPLAWLVMDKVAAGRALKPQALANLMNQVWQKAIERPPPLPATIVLLVVYGVFWTAAIGFVLLSSLMAEPGG